MPKTFSIGGSGIGKVENVVVATHEVDHPRGDRQVDVWLILWIAIELEDARHFRNEHGALFERCKESMGNLISQCGKLLPDSWTGQHVANLGHDSVRQIQLDHIRFNQEQACSSSALALGGALKKHHAVEYGADLRTISAHRLDADRAPGKILRVLGRRGDPARRH